MPRFVVNILIFGKVYVHVDTYSFSNRLARRYETLVSRDEILGSLSNDNGDGNENVISKYKFALF